MAVLQPSTALIKIRQFPAVGLDPLLHHHRCRRYSCPKARPPRQSNQSKARGEATLFCSSHHSPTNTSVGHIEGMLTGKGEELGCSPSPDTTETTPHLEENSEVWVLSENNSAMELHPSHMKKNPVCRKWFLYQSPELSQLPNQFCKLTGKWIYQLNIALLGNILYCLCNHSALENTLHPY